MLLCRASNTYISQLYGVVSHVMVLVSIQKQFSVGMVLIDSASFDSWPIGRREASTRQPAALIFDDFVKFDKFLVLKLDFSHDEGYLSLGGYTRQQYLEFVSDFDHGIEFLTASDFRSEFES